MKASYGCENDTSRRKFGRPIFVVPEYGELWRCPVALLLDDPGAREAMRLWGFWKQGVLPAAGGLYNQTEGYITAMEIIDHTVDLVKTENAEKSRGK